MRAAETGPSSLLARRRSYAMVAWRSINGPPNSQLMLRLGTSEAERRVALKRVLSLGGGEIRDFKTGRVTIDEDPGKEVEGHRVSNSEGQEIVLPSFVILSAMKHPSL